MTVLVVHDREGSIASVIISPPDGPPAAGLTDGPHRVSEVEATEAELEFTRQDDERQAIEALSSLRVEITAPGRLVRRSESS
jgi:hypothetical protein